MNKVCHLARLLLPCLGVVVAAGVPFLAIDWSEKGLSPLQGLTATTVFIVVAGFLAVVVARRNVNEIAKAASGYRRSAKCNVCGSDAGAVLCLGCGSVQPRAFERADARPVRASALLVRRWPVLLGFLATVYLPGAYGILREASRAQEERLQRERDAAQAFASAWADFRGPLIAFGVRCGPTARQPSDVCDELVGQIAKGYARMSWYMPSVLADLRTNACAPPPGGEHGRAKTMSGLACRTLQSRNSDAEPSWPSSAAFKTFMNAYARYRAEAKASLRPRTIAALGKGAAGFYWETRKLGCALVFARMSELQAKEQEGLSRFCSRYLRQRKYDDKHWLAWQDWFEETEPLPIPALPKPRQ